MSDSEQEERKSRSQLKRDFVELKKLAIQLVDLPEGQLRRIPLSEKTRIAVVAARSMTRRALQRQVRHLAALIDEEDVSSVRAALKDEDQPHVQEISALHYAEKWRDKLLSGDEALLGKFVEQHPECDRQHLRQLVRNAREEREDGKAPKSARQLFRYMRQLAERPR